MIAVRFVATAVLAAAFVWLAVWFVRRGWPQSRGDAGKDRLLADGKTVWLAQMEASELAELVEARLPEISQAVRDHAGLLHLQVAAIGEELMRQVRAGQVEYPLRILTFFEDVLSSGKVPHELENALEISFITTTDLCETADGRRVAQLTPERVRSMISRTG